MFHGYHSVYCVNLTPRTFYVLTLLLEKFVCQVSWTCPGQGTRRRMTYHSYSRLLEAALEAEVKVLARLVEMEAWRLQELVD